jgi:hypothetical protein
MKNKRPRLKPGGWRNTPSKPLTPEGKKRRAAYLRNWNLYMNQLAFAEAERR